MNLRVPWNATAHYLTTYAVWEHGRHMSRSRGLKQRANIYAHTHTHTHTLLPTHKYGWQFVYIWYYSSSLMPALAAVPLTRCCCFRVQYCTPLFQCMSRACARYEGMEGGKDMASLILTQGTRSRWSDLRSSHFSPGPISPVTYDTAGDVGPTAGLAVLCNRKISSLYRDSNPDRPSPCPSQYQR